MHGRYHACEAAYTGEMYCGVLPESVEIGRTDLQYEKGGCLLDMKFGCRWPGGRAWEGMQSFSEGDRLTLVLNPMAGSLIVKRNGQPIGVIPNAVQIGRFRFAVLLVHPGDIACIGDSATVVAGVIPTTGLRLTGVISRTTGT